jgi:hypothetical protein
VIGLDHGIEREVDEIVLWQPQEAQVVDDQAGSGM